MSWRWIFLVNLPIGLIALVVGWRKLQRVPGHNSSHPHFGAALVVTAGVASLVFAIVKINDWGWHSPGIIAACAATVIFLGWFVAHCLRSSDPFIDPHLFRIRPFTGAALAIAPFSAAFGALLLSIQSQHYHSHKARNERVDTMHPFRKPREGGPMTPAQVAVVLNETL